MDKRFKVIDEVKWDLRFLDMATMVSGWSKDPSTKCGAVITRPDKTVVSVGYNGFPRGCDDSPAIYADRELKYARVVHAEVNAILSAREPLHGYTLYSVPAGLAPTCERCATCVIQAGITRVVHYGIDPAGSLNNRWLESWKLALDLFHESGVEIVTYDPEPSRE